MKKITSLNSHVIQNKKGEHEIILIALFEDNTIWEKIISNAHSEWRRLDNYVPITGKGELDDNDEQYKKYLAYKKSNKEEDLFK